MAQKITDPLSFLTNLLTNKGRSDLYGIYLTSVTVLAECEADYNYDVSESNINFEVESLLRQDEDDWNRLLVQVRRDQNQIVFPIAFLRNREPVTTYLIVEGNEISLSVFIPTLVLNEFVTEVTFYQHLLREVALFAGKTPTSIRFTIGAVSMEWDEVVERGCAREVDVGF